MVVRIKWECKGKGYRGEPWDTQSRVLNASVRETKGLFPV